MHSQNSLIKPIPPSKPYHDIHNPSIAELTALQQTLSTYILDTPVIKMPFKACELFAKVEIWQKTGSFKIRAVFNWLLNLNDTEKKQGIVTASAGNHAIAVSYAAAKLGIDTKIFMPKTASRYKIETCQTLGADVILAENFIELFKRVEQCQQTEGRFFIHPYESPYVSAATAVLGMEIHQQIPNLDAIVVAVGGGGLISGISYAIKTLNPNCQVYGVEPTGATTMATSFKQGHPAKLSSIDTIAQSLSAPEAKPYSYELCTRHVDAIALIEDKDMLAAMRWLCNHMKLIVEPAAAAGLAAIKGPLANTLKNKRVATILCGSNMDITEYNELMAS